MKKIVVLMLVVGMVGIASAAVSDTFEDSTLGVLDGQDGGSGWNSAWYGSGSFNVLAETGNQYLSIGEAATKSINRDVIPFFDDVYSFSFDVRMNSRQDTWGTGTPSEIQLREASGADPVHLKFESSEWIRLGNVWLVDYGAIADAGDASPSALKDLYADWVSIRVDMDEAAGTAKLYWEQNDGMMAFVGDGAMEAGTAGVAMDDIKIQTRAGGVGSEFELNNLSIVPEPATLLLLGLGGLSLIRRKR